MGYSYKKSDIPPIVLRRSRKGWKPLKLASQGLSLSLTSSFIRIWSLRRIIRIVADTIVKVLSTRDTATAQPRPYILSLPAYLPANATYKHQFNVWNLSKWISLGSYRWPSFFFPRRIRSWCEISLYYCLATTWPRIRVFCLFHEWAEKFAHTQISDR